MKPAFWIGILALFGAIVGYFMYRSTGWLGSGIGIVVSIIVSALIYNILTRRTKLRSWRKTLSSIAFCHFDGLVRRPWV